MKEGMIKNIGVSNFSVESLREAQKCAKNKIVSNQVHYNLINREPELSGLLDFCQRNDVMLTAYRPLEKGLLIKGDVKILGDMCEKYGKTPAQIALNWLISQRNVVTISKSTNIDHLKDNLGSVGWTMGAKDVETLRKDFPGQRTKSNVIPLG